MEEATRYRRLKQRTRADKRRLRALFDAGEIVESHGLLGDKAALRDILAQRSSLPRQALPPPSDRVAAQWRGQPAGARVRPPRASFTRRARILWLLAGLLMPWWIPFVVAWRVLPRARLRPAGIQVWLGQSTGLLYARGRYRRRGRHAVVLAQKDMGQNLLVLGGIGSGKTTSVIQPVLLQCLTQGVGGLIFDIKGDFGGVTAALCVQAQRRLIVIGPKRTSFNLLRGLTPETAASFLKSALLLSGSSGDPFWVETAVELCRNALGVLSFLPEHYSLSGLYQYLFHDDARTLWDQQLHDEVVGLSPQALRLLRSYQAYHEGVFTRFDPKVVAGVLASAAQILTPFTHPDLVDAFCPPVDAITMEGLGAGEIVLVDLPLAVWGLGAKVIYTFLKLRFFQFMQRRPLAERRQPVFFCCDEYQEIVSANKDGLSDLNFWDKGRAFGTLGIISAQSIASFYAALGDHDLADTLLQNFRQKVCLRTEDMQTVMFFRRLLGDTERAEGRDRAIVSALLARRLHDRQALAVLSVEGESLEDVIDLPTVFVGSSAGKKAHP